MEGSLYLIGTPIGNLGDITQRAVETLRSLDLLYCEDTRVTSKLLAHIGARPSLRNLSDDAPEARWQEAVAAAQAGKRVGFVTDAGMPGVSDPGRKLVRCAWAAGLAPVVIPGPSSVGTLLAACPFVDNSFRFAGFAPRKQGERKAFCAGLGIAVEPWFFFEAPTRAHHLLDEICAALEPSRQVLIGREMTKVFEQFVLFEAGQWPELRDSIPAKGEFTIAVAALPVATADSIDETPSAHAAAETRAALARLEAAGFAKRHALQALAAVWELAPNALKRQLFNTDSDE